VDLVPHFGWHKVLYYIYAHITGLAMTPIKKHMEAHTHNTDGNHTVSSTLLLLGAWVMEYFRKTSMSEGLSLLLQVLSVISVLLIIVINLPKAGKVLTSIFKRKKRNKAPVQEVEKQD